MLLEGKVALVTGGGRGIGKAIALALAREGASVIVNDYIEDMAKAVVEEIKALGREGESVCADISKFQEANNMIKDIIKNKSLHILINNAGITRDNLLVRMKEEDWDQVLSVNLKGIFNCTHAVARSMMKQRFGRIINMASIVGLIGNEGQANYAASKSGIIGFSKSVAKELATRGVTVNVIAPGFIKTAMTDNLSEEAKTKLFNLIPMKRLGTPEDIAPLVVFLCSDEASYITGQVINIDGGIAM
ncbi:MAG: 3-oxoacyl-(acyl-carrier-protein) reductase FabG [bacterium ADurb.Bin363]|nr:MAG: 3-oxoacyl-(acyl-carrier-protein) reductase FabG [bacterium ADurb.Bin363]